MAEIKPDCRSMEKDRKLANEHWQFLQKWLGMMFVDGFIHGYKHGKEDAGDKGLVK